LKTAYPALQEPERLEPVPSLTPAIVPEPVINLKVGDEPANNGRAIEVFSSKPEKSSEPAENHASNKEIVPVSKGAPKPPPKKIEAKQEVLQFDAVSRGRFEKSEPTIVDGQDLDVPTFLRTRVKAG
jgi:cell division protein FtsZ